MAGLRGVKMQQNSSLGPDNRTGKSSDVVFIHNLQTHNNSQSGGDSFELRILTYKAHSLMNDDRFGLLLTDLFDICWDVIVITET